MDPAEFNDIKGQLKGESFSDAKLEVLRSRISYSSSFLSVMQVAELVKELNFDDDQLKALEICQAKMIPASCAEVVSLLKVFSFAGTKVKVVEAIASKISDPFNHHTLDAEIAHRSDQEKVQEILRSAASSTGCHHHHPPQSQQSPHQPHYYPHPNQPTYITGTSQQGYYSSGTVLPPGQGGYSYPTSGPGTYQPQPGTYPTGPGTYQPAPGTYPTSGLGAYQLQPGTYPTGQGVYQLVPGTYPPGQGAYQPVPGTYPSQPGTYSPRPGTYPAAQGHPSGGYPPY